MQPALGHEKEAAELSKARSPLTGEVEKILKEAREKVRLEARTAIFEKGHKLKADDLKIPIDPEEFTKQEIIEKVFRTLRVEFSKERHFKWLKELRKADYEGNFGTNKFLVEAKPLNLDLKEGSGAAVEQVKELFRLSDVKENYTFGIATDGLQWIFIDREGKEIIECSLLKDFSAIEALITGKKPAKAPKREAEISRRFYKWYNALLHGGSYHDLEGERRSISEEDCLVRNISNVSTEEEREEIAQVIVDRLIFIKFLQVKGLIKEDLLTHLATLGEDILNSKLKQLFFNVLNTEEGKRPDVDPKFREVPYLNGSLFVKIRAEEKNSDYLVKAEILKKVIEFLGAFRFVSRGEAVEEFLDPEILGYLFERAMTATDRKGTGAYYTPKTITRYICENTIYPYTLEGARAFLKAKKGYREEELPKTFDDLLRVGGLTLSDIYAEIIQKVTVLDPACGSGAFLYQAGNVLLEICKRVEEILGLRNSEIALKKVILKNSLYGVDINHKAVEIAKLRLWLWMAESYNPDQKPEPLPNIEYNIRPGNSLVGYIDISRFRETKVSMDDYLGVETPVMDLIKERDDLLKEYKSASGEKAHGLKKRLQELDGKIKGKLDIHLFQEMQGKKIPVSPTDYAMLEPFHWGFDFHKVFENGAGGFSVVIGNPPYVRQEALKEQKQIYKEYYETYHGVADLYVYFYERGHKLLGPGGRFGFISSNKFMRANYGQGLKEFLTHDIYLAQIIDFGDLPVFEDATAYPVIFLTERSETSGRPTLYTQICSLDFQSVESVVEASGQELPESAFQGSNWFLGSKKELGMMQKIEALGQPLGDYVGGITRRGILTGFNEAFVIDEGTRDALIKEDPRSAEIIKLLLVGDDIGKYEINFRDRYLIFTRHGIDIDSYPAIKRHLERYKEQLTPRPQNWAEKKNGKSKGRKPGPYQWYEIQDTVAYYADFEKPKIVYLVFQVRPAFYFDNDGLYCNNAVWIIPRDDKFLVSILNSKLGWYLISKKCTQIQNGYQLIWDYFKNVPIRHIFVSTPEPERQRLVEEMKALYSKGDLDQIPKLVEGCLPRDEQGKEKSDVVHDLLALLAGRMIEMNKEKQGEIRRFLERLEDNLGAKIEDLTGKAALREYYLKGWDEVKKVLDKNRAKVKKIGEAGVLEELKREFEGSKEELAPLLAKIENTDRLIDQIVYRLYGLTEEEIKVVEGG